MRLFYIYCEQEGDSFDQFISARTVGEALECWLKVDFVQSHEIDDNTNINVFLVPSVNPNGGHHGWHKSWESRGVQSAGYFSYGEVMERWGEKCDDTKSI